MLMAVLVTMVRTNKFYWENRVNQGDRRGWREICEDVLREKDPERVNTLLEELLEELEEYERKRRQ
jgi:hypothetical protein